MIRCSKPLLMLAAVLMLSACRDDPAEQQADDVSTSRYRADVGPSGEAVVPGERGGPRAQGDRAVIMASDTEPAYLTDAAGQTLYVLAGNDDGSRCDRACEEAWPPVVAEEAEPVPGSGLQRELLGTTPRQDGGLHVTYDGKPLYRYAADAGAGRTAGHEVEDQWGKWSMVSVHGPAVPAE
ncbi:COG4315 family predicted lipoprotein [Luteimonas suaedae]|uniref:COG4315 family predicted lipoprotein n=1 Tax=Luteimonas suaedae TaxID=2605430 RepID=UPI0016597AA2|nr:hypothetical protein [Luteimonas suaedae]